MRRLVYLNHAASGCTGRGERRVLFRCSEASNA